MNDKTKWENAHFEHDANPVDGSMYKPAAAQEAGTVEIIGLTYLLRDVTKALAKAGHAPVAAAPVVDPLRLGAAMTAFDAAGGHAVRYAPEWMRKALEAASTPAALGIKLHAPCTEAVYALARKLLWIAYVWNDHNFDHPYKIARALAQEFGIESFDQANAWLGEQAKLIDASPKGGEHFQDRLAEIEGRPRPEPEVDEVEEVAACLGDDAAAMLDENPEDERALNMQRAAELLTAMQATSAEVGA